VWWWFLIRVKLTPQAPPRDFNRERATALEDDDMENVYFLSDIRGFD